MVRVNSVKYNSVGIGAKTRRMATVEMRTLHVIKGKCQEGEVFSLRTEVSPTDEKDRTLFAEYQGRKGRRLVLVKRDNHAGHLAAGGVRKRKHQADLQRLLRLHVDRAVFRAGAMPLRFKALAETAAPP